MLRIVTTETKEELELLRSQNKTLLLRQEGLEQGLKRSYESGRFLEKMGEYWKEFVR